MKITVLGSGGWGIALAMSAERNGHNVTLWSPFEKEVNELLINRESKKLLKGIKISPNIAITTDFSVTENSDVTIIAVPSIAVRETVLRLKDINNPGIVVNVAKGFEPQSLKRLSEVITEEISAPVVVMSGPSHAEEVARKVPTSLVACSKDIEAAKTVIDIFANEYLRLYTNDDMVGVELGGALKNIIAVAAGACDGLGLGDNTRAALITRGLTEIARLGVALGAKERTFAGLTGLGDLVVTCTSKHSRNHRFGELIGQGMTVKEALEEVGTVEGYYATALAYKLALEKGAEMPIIAKCYEVLYNNENVAESIKDLMLRPTRDEHESLWIG
jgi:glycerol-3-phosphate dehydrogenase (NAD(P)+)